MELDSAVLEQKSLAMVCSWHSGTPTPEGKSGPTDSDSSAPQVSRGGDIGGVGVTDVDEAVEAAELDIVDDKVDAAGTDVDRETLALAAV